MSSLAEPETPAPEGFVKVGWYSFPSYWGPWRPSKVHLAREYGYTPICGARQGRRAKASYPYDMRDQERDAGLCRKCWKSAGTLTR